MGGTWGAELSALMEAGGLVELRPSSAGARPSSDQSFIQSKSSFILSRGHVVKNISNDDSDTQWVKTFGQSFISHEMFYCDPSSDPRGDCCPLEPEHSFDRAQRPSSPLSWSRTSPFHILGIFYFHAYVSAADGLWKSGNGYLFQRALQIKRSPTFGNGYGITSSSRL